MRCACGALLETVAVGVHVQAVVNVMGELGEQPVDPPLRSKKFVPLLERRIADHRR